MKSTVLVGTLAATLVSTLHADVFVIGASWRERSIEAPEGVIERKMRNTAAPRAYVIMENATAPQLNGAFIEYNNDGGLKTFTVTTNFTGFTADMVEDINGSSQRIFGHIFTPVTTADVPNAMMPFSGSVFGTTKPRRLTFDRTVFQSGDSTAPGVVVPNLVRPGTMARSILTGTGSDFEVESTTLAGAVTELTGRLIQAGYTRNVVAPVITTEPVAPPTRAGFVTASVSVAVNPDAFPAPTFQWFKEAGAVDTPVGTNQDTFTIPAGNPGTGTFYVVVTNSAGSDTSANVVIAAPSNVVVAPLTALPTPIGLANPTASATLNPGVNANAWPQPTYQWKRANGTSGVATFVDVPAGDGGTQPTFTVVGDLLNTVRGSGARYQVVVTQANTPVLTLTSTTATVTTP